MGKGNLARLLGKSAIAFGNTDIAFGKICYSVAFGKIDTVFGKSRLEAKNDAKLVLEIGGRRGAETRHAQFDIQSFL